MDSAAIKQQLHNYLEIANDKKLKAIYVMVEDEIRKSKLDLTQEEKAELESRVSYYENGGKMVTPSQMKKRLETIRQKAQK